jgi:hypothetical protein
MLRYAYFPDNRNGPDNNDLIYKKLWNLRHIFDLFNDTYSKYYAPSENFAVDN